MTSILERLRAEAAAKKAATQPSSVPSPAPSTASSSPSTSSSNSQPTLSGKAPFGGLAARLAAMKAGTADATAPVVPSSVSSEAGAAKPAELTGVAALLARKKAEADSKVQDSVAKQQTALEKARELLQRKQEAGTYSIDSETASKFPQELDPSAVGSALRELDAALMMKTPELRNLVLNINRNLRQYEELAYLLTDEQLSILVSGNLYMRGIELAQSGKGSKTTAELKSLTGNLSVDDF